MYQPLLANRYLGSRIIPLIAVAAVALCVALVIIVVSVMSGFLDMLLSSGRTLMGDVIVRGSDAGIPYYEEFINDLERNPDIAAATPVVESFGLLKLPYSDQGEGAQIWGIDPESFNRVVNLEASIVWSKRPDSVEDIIDLLPDDQMNRPLRALPTLVPPSTGDDPGVLLGVEFDNAAKSRTIDGTYVLQAPQWWMPLHTAEITLVPMGHLEKPFNLRFKIENEFQTGVYQIDSRRAMIDLATAQRMLNLDAAPLYDPDKLDEGEFVQIGTSPARAQMILVRGTDGVNATVLRAAVTSLYEQWTDRLATEDRAVQPPAPVFISVKTWREQLRDLIGPVEKERELMRILFSIVYLVCAGLVLSIFWAIVHEKTRDIGILRAIGASRPGILSIFLTYGLIIGAAGAALGSGLAYIVVENINAIHEGLGHPAPTVLIVSAWSVSGLAAIATFILLFRDSILKTLLATILTIGLVAVSLALTSHRGFLMWDPSVYYFNEIPNHVDWFSAILTMAGAIVFSVLGAAIPAARAADTDPVQALRYE